MSRSQHETYTLTIERSGDGRIVGYDLHVVGPKNDRQVRLNGYKAPAVTHQLFDLLKRYGVTGRQWSGRKPIELDFHDAGPHGELFLKAVKPLRNTSRIDQIARVLSKMSREEALYWCAKSTRRFGTKALRLICDGAEAL
jgi:hypothetical protein